MHATNLRNAKLRSRMSSIIVLFLNHFYACIPIRNKILLNEMKRARLKQMKEPRDKYVTCVH